MNNLSSKRKIVGKSWMIALCGLLLSACSGVISVTEEYILEAGSKCARVVCDGELICVDGDCVPPPGPCNVSDPDGICDEGLRCYSGVCLPSQSAPKDCLVFGMGVCSDNKACVEGACIEVSADTACGPQNLEGLCPGGQLCVHGACYADIGQTSPSIQCSSEELEGACPQDQSCIAGACQRTTPTCSALNFEGECHAWQACVQGECVGPAPPDGCSLENPFGRCPGAVFPEDPQTSFSVCVAGTCTPVDPESNACSPTRPNGLCPHNAACQDGRCYALDNDNRCSANNPTGLCTGGGVCVSGSCESSPACGTEGGLTCVGTSARCDASQTCTALPCAPTSAQGICTDMTQVCEGGLCVEESCSLTSGPSGRCALGLECQNGACVQPQCAPGVQNGICPDPVDICNNDGTCSEGPCGAENVDGICTETDTTVHPVFGDISIPTQCEAGSCIGLICGPGLEGDGTSLNGRCDAGSYCDNGTCTEAPCSAFYQDGFCPTGQICSNATCRISPCTQDPSVCGEDQCDVFENVCVQKACAPDAQSGFCTTPGQTCCNTDIQADNPGCTLGTCIEPRCGPAFPGGTCDGVLADNSDGFSCTDETCICALGACLRPPCSNTFPDGTCGRNYACEEQNGVSQCNQQDCSLTAPGGACTGEEVCVSEEDGSGTVTRAECLPVVCGADFPNGGCLDTQGEPISGQGCCDSTLAAASGCDSNNPSCVVVPCATDFPGGACASDETCAGTLDGGGNLEYNCTKLPCRGITDGVCPAGFECQGDGQAPENFTCQQGACSAVEPINAIGTCPAQQICRVEAEKFNRPTGGQDILDPAPGCIPYACGYTDDSDAPIFTDLAPCPRGVLPECDEAGEQDCVCQNNVCVPPPQCGTNPGESLGGSCDGQTPTGGSEACDNTDTPCVCASGSCAYLPCSPSTQNGFCGNGFVCCDETGNDTPEGCAARFGAGVCVRANCQDSGANEGICYGSEAGLDCEDSNTCAAPVCESGRENGGCFIECDLVGDATGCTDVGGDIYYQPTAGVFESAPGRECNGEVGSEACAFACRETDPCVGQTEDACNLLDKAVNGDICTWNGSSCEFNVASFPTTPTPWLAGQCPKGLDVDADGSSDKLNCIVGRCLQACDINPDDGADADCDGIADIHEQGSVCGLLATEGACDGNASCTWLGEDVLAAAGCYPDTDNDGALDLFDRDADGDSIPDSIERGGVAPPVNTDGIDELDFQDTDSDNDFIADALEVGGAPTAPRDFDLDGTPDYLDTDSDGDGILDILESSVDGATALRSALLESQDLPADCTAYGAQGACEGDASGLCFWQTATDADACVMLLNIDGDIRSSLPAYDWIDTDSDNDAILDSIEQQTGCGDHDPQSTGDNCATTSALDIDSDDLVSPRDLDSDGDGLRDNQEDTNGDGVVNCQRTGAAQTPVPDTRAPACDAGDYTYNEGCNRVALGETKCLLAETSRLHADTDEDGIDDNNDGIFQVCASGNAKEVNVFYDRNADYAFALEPQFSTINEIDDGSGGHLGFLFDDPEGISVPTLVDRNGSAAVAGFVLRRTIGAGDTLSTVDSITRPLPDDEHRAKALGIQFLDQESIRATLEVVDAQVVFAQVLSRNGISFDGFASTIARYAISLSAPRSMDAVRNDILTGLVANNASSLETPSWMNHTSHITGATEYTLLVQTLYRHDDPGLANDAAMTVATLSPTGGESDDQETLTYRSNCGDPTLNSETPCNARAGCAWSGSICEPKDGYQLPLFFATNPTDGSALAQYGDDRDTLCQSIIQEYIPVDFLWVIDTSKSMEEEIGQVLTSSQLFFGLMNLSEADYRVGQTTTELFSASIDVGNSSNSYDGTGHFPPFLDIGSGDGLSGNLSTFFTGAKAGQTTGLTDRHVNLSCGNSIADRCNTGGLACSQNATAECCDACDGNPGGNVNDPACYFAANLPCTSNSAGEEHGHMAAIFALDAGGVAHACDAGTDEPTCTALPHCVWQFATDTASNESCLPNYCESATSNIACTDLRNTITPPAGDENFQSVRKIACEWLDNKSVCVPAVKRICAGLTPSQAGADPSCTLASAETGGYTPPQTNPNTCGDVAGETDCNNSRFCTWNAGGSICESNSNIQREFRSDADHVVVFLADEEDCLFKDGQDGTYDGQCTPQFTNEAMDGAGLFLESYTGSLRTERTESLTGFYQSRNTSVFAIVGDKADASTTPGTTNGGCQRIEASCGLSNKQDCNNLGTNCVFDPNFAIVDCSLFTTQNACEPQCTVSGTSCQGDGGAPNNFTATESHCRAFNTNTEVFTGNEDLLYLSLCPTTANLNDTPRLCAWDGSQCNHAVNAAATSVTGGASLANLQPGKCYTNRAEAGQAYIDVAEQTEGGWGSICAPDLYPTIEGIVLASLNKASPYVLELVDANGNALQPIASTLQVSAEVCDEDFLGAPPAPQNTWLPSCINNAIDGNKHTVMRNVARSRDSGFDYDGVRNTILLFGDARPVEGGDIVVSYQYWQNNTDEVGPDDCECPAGDSPGCECPSADGTVFACGGAATSCGAIVAQNICDTEPGCAWNTALNSCEVTGVCEPDPDCGGGCPENFVCNEGLCECDVGCVAAGGCSPGSTCESINDLTCNGCVCDDTCGGACPSGTTCNDDLQSPTCGVCECQTDCGGITCAAGLSCDADTDSPTCGTCQPDRCTGGDCGAGQECLGGFCVCDTDCGAGCAQGQSCDTNTTSNTCGQCICDATCGGVDCAAQGLQCDTTTSSATCGLCVPDPTCGGNCTEDKCLATDIADCTNDADCRISLDDANLCVPRVFTQCNPSTGLCELDPICQAPHPDSQEPDITCFTGELCDGETATCVCDNECSQRPCLAGEICSTDPAVGVCGTCVCDTTCGGSCPLGSVCETEGENCGQCVVPPNCGDNCAENESCDELTGICEVICPEECPQGTICIPGTNGECVCDPSCGGGCGPGELCQTTIPEDPEAPACGTCFCDTTCGGEPCPQGQVCSSDPASCGLCIIDPTCGDSCQVPQQVCNPTTGFCQPNCNAPCPPNFERDPSNCLCIPIDE